MSLKERLNTDLKQALYGKEELKVSVLRMLAAAMINKEKGKRAKLSKDKSIAEEDLIKLSGLNDEEIVETIMSEAKKRRDSIEQFEKGNRPDLVEKEKKESEILQVYLPQQMSEEDVRKIVKEKIAELNIIGLQEKGRLMSNLMPRLKGKADGNLVNKIVQEELGK